MYYLARNVHIKCIVLQLFSCANFSSFKHRCRQSPATLFPYVTDAGGKGLDTSSAVACLHTGNTDGARKICYVYFRRCAANRGRCARSSCRGAFLGFYKIYNLRLVNLVVRTQILIYKLDTRGVANGLAPHICTISRPQPGENRTIS